MDSTDQNIFKFRNKDEGTPERFDSFTFQAKLSEHYFSKVKRLNSPVDSIDTIIVKEYNFLKDRLSHDDILFCIENARREFHFQNVLDSQYVLKIFGIRETYIDSIDGPKDIKNEDIDDYKYPIIKLYIEDCKQGDFIDWKKALYIQYYGVCDDLEEGEEEGIHNYDNDNEEAPGEDDGNEEESSEGMSDNEEYQMVILDKCIEMIKIVNWLHNTCDVIHRDIKPDNFFVSNDNILKIGDFENAIYKKDQFSQADIGKKMGNYVGSIFTRPPDLQTHFGTEMDIFALGVSVFFILEGFFPYNLPSQQTEEQLHIHMREMMRDGIEIDAPHKNMDEESTHQWQDFLNGCLAGREKRIRSNDLQGWIQTLEKGLKNL